MRRWHGFSSGALAVTVASGLFGTAFGLGAAGQAPEIFDGSAWLWSRTVGQLARVNGNSGTVDLHYDVEDSLGNRVVVAQDGDHLLLHDQAAGAVSSVDLAGLALAGTQPVPPGGGAAVVLSGGNAAIVDRTNGLVRMVDPTTLRVLGAPLSLTPPLVGGDFDAAGRLWLGVPTEGTVVALRFDTDRLSVERTVPVATPGADLAITVLDDGVLAIDRGGTAMTVVVGDEEHPLTSPVPLAGAGLPSRTTGDLLVVTVEPAHALVVVDELAVRSLRLPATGGMALPFAGRIYIPDDPAGIVHVREPDGGELPTVQLAGARGPLELAVREGLLFVNAVDAPAAAVVDPAGEVSYVDKFDPDATLPDRGEQPAEPEPGAGRSRGAPEPTPKRPRPGPPGAPAPVTALPGDGQVEVRWAAAPITGGAAVDSYLVTWDGGEAVLAGDTLSTVATGLVNGQEYQFRVVAENEFGQSPPGLSEPVTPVAAAPPRPARPTATVDRATVSVSWQGVDGAVEYEVTPLRDGESSDPSQTVTGTSTEFEGLTLGGRYTFVVTARSAGGGASDPSPPSNQVVPFTTPDPPGDLVAEHVNDTDIRVGWSAPDGNGRPIDHYVIRDGEGAVVGETADTQLTLTVTSDVSWVSVAAVNEAGEGDAASAEVLAPEPPSNVSLTSVMATDSQVFVSVDVEGDPEGCTVTVDGLTAGCGDHVEVTGEQGYLQPDTAYTVTVTLPDGSSDAAQFTTYPRGIQGTHICEGCADGAPFYDEPGGTIVGYHGHGGSLIAVCRVTGPNVDGTDRGGRESDQWIYKAGARYTPWALATLDDGADVSDLPPCRT